jgi:hypothetical protein
MVAALNIVGLILALAGVLVLFRFGMPYRTRTGGWPQWVDDNPPDQNQIGLERRYDRYGWVGLFCIVAGTLCQIIANLL